MKTTIEMALKTLERCVATCFDQYAHEQVMGRPEHFVNQTITAIKEALAQPEQEPVGRNRTWTPSEWTEYERSIAAAEREACAEVCKKHADVYAGLEQNPTAKSAWAACIDNRDTILARPTAQEMHNAAANLALMREMWGDPNQPAAKVNDEGFIVETGLLLSPGTLLYTTPPAAQPEQERNFCPRCGKRVGDYIHTCTPPKEKYTYGTPLMDAMTQDYVSPQRKPLTNEQISEIAINNPPTVHEFARAIEAAHGITGENT